MSDRAGDQASDRHVSKPPAQEPLPAPSLDALALAEALAEMRAAGAEPRLSALMGALPHATGVLSDAIQAQAEEGDDGEEGAPDAAEPVQLSSGTWRALDALFGAEDEGVGGLEAYRAGDEPGRAAAMVAEALTVYNAQSGATMGLLAFAREQRLDAEALAAQVMLSSAAVRWLDRVAIPPAQQPAALVAHLAGALGVERERIQRALAHGEPDAENVEVRDRLLADGVLTPLQRSYWLALLSRS